MSAEKNRLGALLFFLCAEFFRHNALISKKRATFANNRTVIVKNQMKHTKKTLFATLLFSLSLASYAAGSSMSDSITIFGNTKDIETDQFIV